MLLDSGSILRVVYFWEVPFALMLSPGWCGGPRQVTSGDVPVLDSEIFLRKRDESSRLKPLTCAMMHHLYQHNA